MAEEFGKYRLIKKIAQGGMAEVFLATQSAALPGFEKQIAIKRIFPNLATDENMRTMFLDEATIAARLNHPNIVQIYDVGEVEQYLFLAMEYVDGYDFRNVLVKAQQKGATLPYPLAVNVIMNAAAGLHHAHTLIGSDGKPMKVIHRDMSPQNILISKGGNVKVCDFGVAKAEVRTGMTRAGELKGKISYMSPEQIEGAVEIDHRSDIFSLGVVLYEATTMTRLFRQGTDYEKMRNILDGNIKPPVEVTPGYPEDLQEIVLKCLANNRDERFQTAKEVQIALDDWLSRTGVSQSALELERFLAFLFEDAPITPTSGTGGSDSFSSIRGSQSRRLMKPRLDSITNKSAIRPRRPSSLVLGQNSEASNLRETAQTRSPRNTSVEDFEVSSASSSIPLEKSGIIAQKAAMRATGRNARVEASQASIPPLSARLAPPRSSYSGASLSAYYNSSIQDHSDIIASGFSKRTNSSVGSGDSDLDPSNRFPSEVDEFDEDESSIAEAIPTAEYQVVPRRSSNPSGEAPVQSVFDPPAASGIIQRGAPPKKRAPRGTSLDLENENASDSALSEELPTADAPSEPSAPSAPGGRKPHPTQGNIVNTAPPTSRATIVPNSAASQSLSSSYEDWDEPVKKKDSNALVIGVIVVLVIVGGAFIFFLNSGSDSNKEGSGALTEGSAAPANTIPTKLSALEPNVFWVINGRVPVKSETSEFPLLKDMGNLVTAYKPGFIPASQTVQAGAEAPRLELPVDNSDLNGKIHITSTPSGATLIIDGETKGVTPTEITGISKLYPHYVSLKLDGHADYVGYIALLDDTNELAVNLKKKDPKQTDVILGFSPGGAVVNLNGKPVTVPTTQSVPAEGVIQVTSPGKEYVPLNFSVDATNLGTLEFKFPLAPLNQTPASLSLKVLPPKTRVFIGDKEADAEHLTDLTVPSGKLTITLQGPSGKGSTELTVDPKGTNHYQLELVGDSVKTKKL